MSTAVEAIAEEAGVALQTIYNAIGSKRAVLSRVLDFAAAGPDAPTRSPSSSPAHGQGSRGAAFARLLADWFAEVAPRVAPCSRDPGSGSSRPRGRRADRQRAAQRLRNYAEGVAGMQRRGIAGGQRQPTSLLPRSRRSGSPTSRMLVIEQGCMPSATAPGSRRRSPLFSWSPGPRKFAIQSDPRARAARGGSIDTQQRPSRARAEATPGRIDAALLHRTGAANEDKGAPAPGRCVTGPTKPVGMASMRQLSPRWSATASLTMRRIGHVCRGSACGLDDNGTRLGRASIVAFALGLLVLLGWASGFVR